MRGGGYSSVIVLTDSSLVCLPAEAAPAVQQNVYVLEGGTFAADNYSWSEFPSHRSLALVVAWAGSACLKSVVLTSCVWTSCNVWSDQ